MTTVATVLATLGFAGAVASWIVAARLQAHTRSAVGHGRLRWLAAAAWPFAAHRLESAPAAKVNKAFVAFFVCLLVALTATSVATNLHRIAR